jgi:uncharacterized protein
MKVFVTGATGFIGRALVRRLGREGHPITALVRDEAEARSRLGHGVELVRVADGQKALVAAIDRADAIVNLAGAPIAGGRFTKKRRAAIERSRIDFTDRLVDAIATAPRRPEVLISASAVGYYGHRGQQRLDETSGRGRGYLADVCARWEAAARRAEALGMRVVRPRFGVVLGLGGGFLGKMLPFYRLGLGVRLGDGDQFVPFIHIDDVVDALTAALSDRAYRGIVNLVAPEPVRMRDLGAVLARTLGRRERLAVPPLFLHLALGEAAGVVLASQRVRSRRLEALGFRHRFPTVEAALSDLVGQMEEIQITPVGAETPAPVADGEAPYLQQRPPRYLLRTEVGVDAPVGDVFDFFSRPQNLGLITPPDMALEIKQAPSEISQGSTIDYSLRVAKAPLRWRTIIDRWAPGRLFVDAQAHGPYRSWWHEHHFREADGGTVMEDRVYYTPPFGVIGRLAQALFIAAQLRHVFGYRSQAVRQRFATARGPTTETELPATRTSL